MRLDDLGRPCGYLQIEEKNKRKKFEKRFFILDKSKGFLEWHSFEPESTSSEGTVCGLIKIDFITKVEVVVKSKMNFCFVVNTPPRPYLMQASDKKDLEQWVETLNNAGKIIVPQEALKTLQIPSNEEDPHLVQEESPNNSVEGEERFTYRTEIVGGVVVKKKVTSDGHIQKSSEEALSPPPVLNENSDSSSFNFLQPSPTSLKTTSQESVNQNDVIKKGWAVKQGHVRKNWKRRFFVLTNDSFSYYKGEHDTESIRTISICDILTAKQDDNKQKQRDNLLFIATTDKIYYMQTDTPEEMTNWVNCIQTAIKQNRVNSQKKKVYVTKSNAKKQNAAGQGHQKLLRGFKGPTNSLHGTGKPIPIVPISQHFSSQVLDMNFGIERSESIEILRDSPHHSSKYLQKRASTNSVFGSSLSHDNTLDLDDVKIRINSENPKAYRSGSAANIFTPQTFSDTKTETITSFAAKKPEEIVPSLLTETQSTSSEHLPLKKTNSNPHSHKLGSKKGLDPIVDHRSAVKPSSVKKKKNSGILFSLNTMLNRKVDHMKKKK